MSGQMGAPARKGSGRWSGPKPGQRQGPYSHFPRDPNRELECPKTGRRGGEDVAERLQQVLALRRKNSGYGFGSGAGFLSFGLMYAADTGFGFDAVVDDVVDVDVS